MNENLKVGDVVVIKWGESPTMTIIKIEEDISHCFWFKGTELKKVRFMTSALKLNQEVEYV